MPAASFSGGEWYLALFLPMALCFNRLVELRHIIAARLHLLHRFSCPWVAGDTPGRRYVGTYGELVAASWLRSQGFRVLRHNFCWGNSGEIDLVCRDGDTLVFVEVKSGTVEGPYPLALKVDAGKRRQIRRGARNWFHLLGQCVPHRFDIVEVQLLVNERPGVNHIADAFPPIVFKTPEWKKRRPVRRPAP